ncbi:hypothetical protein [Peijinzhouia sedimentorum]|tara:strand:+ start:253 stop:609 length:357 start_codon:yes stop_codon:yes gene_type:complete
MKLPSLFPTSKYQRYNVTPRYYDPIKEDIEQRTNRIKRNIESDRSQGIFHYESDFRGAFARQRSREDLSSTLIRMLLFMVFFGFLFGYIYIGPQAFYALGLVLPAYLIYRVKDIFKRS